MTNRKIIIELCYDNGEFCEARTVSYEWLSVADAAKRLATRMANEHFYRVSPVDRTGNLPDDDERFEADLAALEEYRVNG